MPFLPQPSQFVLAWERLQFTLACIPGGLVLDFSTKTINIRNTMPDTEITSADTARKFKLNQAVKLNKTFLVIHTEMAFLHRSYISAAVVSMLYSGAERPGFKSQPRCCWVTVLGKVARVTVGLAESNGSLPSGLWLTSPAGWLPRTGISSGPLRSVIDYGLPLPF